MKLVVSALCVLALALAATMFSRFGTAVDFVRIEWIIVAFVVVAALARWWLVARRRERQKLEAMRDSALW